MAKRVCIKFCGGCNPRIDRGRVAREIATGLRAHGYEVVHNNLAADFTIFLSGCSASCVNRSSYREGIPHVAIAASTVDAVKVGEREISACVIKKVRDYFAGLEKPL